MPNSGSTSLPKRWQFWIDRGGTFTDIVALSPRGELVTHKLLSENPEQYKDAAIQGIRDILDLAPDQAIPAEQIEVVKMGTTVATNALLEHQGARTLLLVTRGFKDALRIAYQNRPRLFDLAIQLPELLYERVIEVNERVDAKGECVLALETDKLIPQLEQAKLDGIDSVALLLMHSYRYPEHEKELIDLCNKVGFGHISASHQVSPLMKLIMRGDTTVVDAYLSPLLKKYVHQVASKLGDTRLLFMQSNGGLTDAEEFAGKDSILSGPAGGIVGAVKTCSALGHDHIIGFDMGGTSTDVSHFAGQYERTQQAMVAGFRIQAPMMQIHTVAAGGGSILNFDGNRFTVGPESASANPGPACYRRGGPLTVTDANVMLGRILPEHFPHTFGPDANQPLDSDIVRQKFSELAQEVSSATGKKLTPESVAEGFLTIAVDNMAHAIKQISTQRGYDVTRYSLCSFGGAGGQHACLVADALGIKTILIHPLSGVLSAYGMGLAELRTIQQTSVETQLNPEAVTEMEQVVLSLKAATQAELIKQGVEAEGVTFEVSLQLKYQGNDTCLSLSWSDAETLKVQFDEMHMQRFGFIEKERSLIIESITVEAIAEQATPSNYANSYIQDKKSGGADAIDHNPLFFAGSYHDTPIFNRHDLENGETITGPAVILESTGTYLILPGWQAQLIQGGALKLERTTPLDTRLAIGTDVDPIMLEVFNNLFMSIAEQMGATLANTSKSVNVKERLDFSCALFDPAGNLVANAPHMPVHLGSMGESVKAIIKDNPVVKAGDVYVTNAPYNGGTHLPDITVITPVLDETTTQPLFFVASRGHHADIGGISPGSMPANSQKIGEEGVLLDNIKLLEGGIFQEDKLLRLLTSGPYPARNPDHNLADLKAQVAANETGIQALQQVISMYGLDTVQAYMVHVQDNAEASVKQIIAKLNGGQFEMDLDDGSHLKVSVRVDKENQTADIDFTGTSEQRPNNFNAPLAICKAAVLYVFRTLVDADIPMNQGCLKPLNLIVPEGCMLNPQYPAAVVAGNVETSQWIVNALYGALGVMAAAQGTMNNFTFGNDKYQYYETICGGTGAGSDFDGCDAVQSHMTNSRLTDPEVLEWRYPVLLAEFSIRDGSGGQGKYKGGNGVTRRIKFLEAMDATILSSHRSCAPFGLNGGRSGKPGVNKIIREDGIEEILKGADSTKLEAGDTFVIETPGGGGCGKDD